MVETLLGRDGGVVDLGQEVEDEEDIGQQFFIVYHLDLSRYKKSREM